MDREAFMDFYSDMSDEDPEYIHEYLAAENIDIDGLQARLLELVEKRKAELKLMEGRDFKSTYEQLKEKANSILGKTTGQDESTMAVAYRKLQSESGEDPEEKADDIQKLGMIKKAKESGKPEGEHSNDSLS